MFITEQAHVPPHRAEGRGRHDGAAAARGDGAGADDLAQGARAGKKLRFVAHRDGARRGRQRADRRPEEPVVAGGDRQRLRPGPELAEPARAVPRLPDHRQQHRRAERRGVHRAGNRRRSLPLERGVPDPVASASRRRVRTCTPASRWICYRSMEKCNHSLTYIF